MAASNVSPIVTEDDGVEILPAVPLDVRGDSAVVWTGLELVVWGGDVEAANMGLPGPDRSYRDGAAYDPVQRSWRTLAPSPLPATTDTSVGVMTDGGVVFARGSATAIWAPATNTWRRLGNVPAWCNQRCWRTGPVRDLSLVGDSVLSYSARASLDVRTGRWSKLPKPPERFERFSVVSTGRLLIVIGGDSALVPNTRAVAYDIKTRTWTELGTPPGLSQQAVVADWDGERVVAVSYDMDAATYEPDTGRWTALPSVPARFYEWYPFLRSAAGESVAFMAATIAVLDRNGIWVPVPYGDVPRGLIAVVDTRSDRHARARSSTVFALGFDDDRRLVLAGVDLNRLVEHPAVVQVGVASVTIPEGYTLAATSYEGSAASVSTLVRLDHSTGDRCVVSSTYGRVPDAQGKQVVSIPMRASSANWYRTTGGTEWETAVTTTDVVSIKCARPDLAEELVRSTAFDVSDQ
jgi:hypothetical protein